MQRPRHSVNVSRSSLRKMNYLIYCVLLCAVCVSANWAPFKALLYSDWIECNHNKTLNLGVSEVQVYFYDFQNNFNTSYPIDVAVEGITSTYNLDVTRKLIFYVPGYKSQIDKNNPELVRQTFKDVQNTYLIIIDHSSYTSDRGGRFESYARSVSFVYYIGKALGKVLADLHNKGYPSKNIHCIGHSLGAQMLGHVGTTYTELTNEKVWRATGIDPAGPCFSNSLIQEQIRSGVAEYVEVYHCNAGELGTTAVLADIDFFMNKKGKKQPPCHEGLIPAKGDSDAAKCSHKECVKYYMLSVHHPTWYLAWACDKYDDFKHGKCAAHEVTLAGYHNPGNATGVFYVSTEGYGID
ncbi:pancreatic triacylglycerol lipase-like [Bombyx mandarina]|uniref:Pancreatic triacylglycerol lipase-like n=1 Tax=Bombyx mandarina TaxID=7092 RepID=A0A6J2JVM2_BOMMA|nr:pancreatic triacylglycerol lipase-like [Bombyx mandarina]XP_028033886.1 pancreatic triacylglycerol lipase-like [Bombyx mandarina]